MKRCRKERMEKSDLRELDKLVLFEINAINRRPQRQHHCPEDSREPKFPTDDRRVEIIKLNEKRRSPGTDSTTDHLTAALEGEDHALAMALGENGEHLRPEESISPDGNSFGHTLYPELARHQDELLSREEEEFIDNTVSWLKERDNKDVIVARIWTLLTEMEPESFYSPTPEQTRGEEFPEPQDASQGADSVRGKEPVDFRQEPDVSLALENEGKT
jgi:hypothetical protein